MDAFFSICFIVGIFIYLYVQYLNTSKEDNSSEIDTILEREKDKEIFYTQQINKLGDEIKLETSSIREVWTALFALYPKFQRYFVEKALANASVSGITDEAALALIEAKAYPHFLDVMAILFLLNVGIMLVIGKLKPRSEDYVQQYTKQVDIVPWKYTSQVGIAICALVIGVYIYFA